MRRVEVPVLVVGAGPVGLTAALALARLGMAAHVVDRRPGPHRAPQAHAVNARSLEIFRQLGVDTGRLRRLATPPADGGHVSWCDSLAGLELGRLGYERQGEETLAVTPEPLINLPQHVLEPVLVDHAVEHPGVTLRWGHEWRQLAEDDGGVTARVADLACGEEYEVRSRWLLAADGAGSPIRKALGVPMDGPDHLQSFVMVHFEANLRPLVRDRPAILYWIMNPEQLGAFVAHDIDRTWVFMHAFDPATDPADSYDATRCATIVRRAIGRDDVPLAVRDVSPWHMTSQVAASYRAGRVFLVGDSAHRFPPAGGMGMNTGIQDAHNLCWKLAAVDAGRAAATLLDTYEIERRPVARHNADQSLLNAMKLFEMAATLGLSDDVAASRARFDALVGSAAGRDQIRAAIEAQRDHFDMLGLQLGFSYASDAIVPDGTSAPVVENPVRDFVPTARPGARMPHAWVERSGRRCSSLDLLSGSRFTLLAGPSGGAWADAAVAIRSGLADVVVSGRDFGDPGDGWRRACALGPDGAVLVRPDQHVAWRMPALPADPGAALAVALAQVTGRRAA